MIATLLICVVLIVFSWYSYRQLHTETNEAALLAKVADEHLAAVFVFDRENNYVKRESICKKGTVCEHVRDDESADDVIRRFVSETEYLTIRESISKNINHLSPVIAANAMSGYEFIQLRWYNGGLTDYNPNRSYLLITDESHIHPVHLHFYSANSENDLSPRLLTRMSDGVVLLCNHAFEELSGYTRSEATGKTTVELGFYDQEHDREKILQLLLAEKIIIRKEFTFRHPNGEQMHLHLSAEKVRYGGADCILAKFDDRPSFIRHENILKSKEAFSRGTLDAIEEFIAVLDEDGNIIEANAKWNENKLSLPLIQDISPENACCYIDYLKSSADNGSTESRSLLQSIQQVMLGKQPTVVSELKCIRDSGAHWIRCKVSQFQLLRENRYVIALEDISGYKTSEEARQFSEARYRYLFDRTAHGLFTCDNSGKFLDANPAFVQLLGSGTLDNLLKSNSCFHHTLTNSRREADELYSKIIRNTQVLSVEKELYRPDGKSIWIKYNISAVKNINGMNDHFIGMVEDITATRQAYRFVRESESYLRAMFECSKQGYIIVDADYTVIRYNQIAEHFLLTELGIDLVKSLRLSSDFDNAKSEKFFESVRAATNGKLMNYLERTVHPDASESWYDMTMVPIYSEKGDQLGLSISIQNVTHVKQYEKTVREKMIALEKTNQELDKFVYSVSHDLRSPLTSILGIINIAQVEQNTPSQKRYLELMEQSVQRLDTYIQDILDYTRNSRMEQKTEKVDFQGLLEIIRNNLRFQTENNKVRLKVHLSENASFYGDEMRLKIILQNLISNAIKYRDNEKPECHISMKIDIGDESVAISVADNGIGIPKEHLEKIFDMFYRVDYRQTGSGLGLYITKESVLKLNGSIAVDSTPGEGTVFQLKVPNYPQYEHAAVH